MANLKETKAGCKVQSNIDNVNAVITISPLIVQTNQTSMKKTLITGFTLAVLGVIAFFISGNPLGRLVKLAIENIGPDMLQVKLSVSHVKISASDGIGHLKGLKIGNPKGFATDHAFKVKNIEIEIIPASLTQETVVIHRVLIDAPHIIFEKGNDGSNFDTIQRNVGAYLGTGKSKADSSAGKKMIIESLVIRNAKVNYNGSLELALPDIELRNIGKNSGGVNAGQLTRAIINELNAKLVSALARTAVVSGAGSVAMGVSNAVKSLLGN